MGHTKGPWKYIDGKAAIISESEYLVPPDKDYEPDGIPLKVLDLTSAMGGTDTTADGYLIAAAPELFDACKNMIDVLNNCPESFNYDPKIKDAIRMAISKAETGE